MYRISDDKRVHKSAESLKAGMLRCMQRMPLNDISVSDLSRESGVCRATFYRIFDTPVDVLSYACDSYVADLLSQIRKMEIDKVDKDALLRFLLTGCMAHSDVVEAIVKSGRPMVLHKSFQMLFSVLFPFEEDFTEDERDYIRSSMSAQFLSILFVWIQHGRRESAGYLLRLFKRFAAFGKADRPFRKLSSGEPGH